jgi:hypothetical protein
MSVIYGCATVTIVAMAGKDADAGLYGITHPRLAQVEESIGGYKLFTLPAQFSVEEEQATYSSRAWTMQEYSLSSRRLMFGESSATFACRSNQLYEETDQRYVSTIFKNHPAWIFMRAFIAEPVSCDPLFHGVTQG